MILHITSPVMADAMSSEDVTKLERAFNTQRRAWEALDKVWQLYFCLWHFQKFRFYFYPKKYCKTSLTELTTFKMTLSKTNEVIIPMLMLLQMTLLPNCTWNCPSISFWYHFLRVQFRDILKSTNSISNWSLFSY